MRRAIPFFYSGRTRRAHAARGRLVDVGTGTPAELEGVDVAGKVVLIRINYYKNAVDPTFSAAFGDLEASGAAAVVGITSGPGDRPVWRNVNSRVGLQSLPTLFVGKETGEEIAAEAASGSSASVTLQASVGRSCDENVLGRLSGPKGGPSIVIGTPTAAWVPSASERGTGVAAFLGLARTYAAMPRSRRPASLTFAALSGHEVGFLGLPALIESKPGLFAKADAYIHLGASVGAFDQGLGPDGTLLQSPDVGDASRALYVSENQELTELVASSFAPGQPIRSVMPSVLNPGEQAYAYKAGVPMVALSGAGYWFHTAGDTVANAVSLTLTANAALAFKQTIDAIGARPRGEITSANGDAAALGAATEPEEAGGIGQPQRRYFPRPIDQCEGNA